LSLSGQLFGGNFAMSPSVIKRSLFGRAVMLVFVLTQVADGLFTYFGIKMFGAAIERNPLVAWYVVA